MNVLLNCGNHFTMDTYIESLHYTFQVLTLDNFICHVYLNKAGKKRCDNSTDVH